MGVMQGADILIIDDDAEVRYSLSRVLSSRGYAVAEASSGEEGIDATKQQTYPVIFLDNRMGGMSGLEALQHLRSTSPNSMIILMTAFGTTQTAIEAMKFGAFDYIIKPFDVRKVLELTHKAIEAQKDMQSAEVSYERIINSEDYKEGIVGDSEPMQAVFKSIGQVATSDVTVMITGESGTGKELAARCIFQHSLRSSGPFMAVNCAAIPDNLIESELFGHEKGAFTGATQQRTGVFEICDGGTLFLDEIGDMTLQTQTKILRALQEGEIQRVGGEKLIKVEVRLIAATNKDLEKLVETGDFREDLYYRLNVMRIRMPSLRERLSDIPALVDFMLQRLGNKRQSRVRRVSKEALHALMHYRWPGNVRELENAVQRCSVTAQGDTILLKDLPPEILQSPAVKESLSASSADMPEESSSGDIGEAFLESSGFTQPSSPPAPESLPALYDSLFARLMETCSENFLQEIEREIMKRVLAEVNGNQVKASALLGITRATLRKRIEAYGFSREG